MTKFQAESIKRELQVAIKAIEQLYEIKFMEILIQKHYEAEGFKFVSGEVERVEIFKDGLEIRF